MEQRDLVLISELMSTNETLQRLMTEHQIYETELNDLDRKLYLSPTDEIERKRIQKLKLRGRDQIERILIEARRAGARI